jgi:UDP-N-acetylglucosamine transferase subunit ALG13
MIFVTVGTHHLPFNRLLLQINDLIKQKIINEKVIIQAGNTKVVVKGALQKSTYNFNDFVALLKQARLIISHAGPATIYQSIVLAGKKPIIIPRLKKYGEHVSDHQLYFAQELAKENKIYLCLNKQDLVSKIKSYQPSKTYWKQPKNMTKKLKKFINTLF